jgi:hypothetical protein
LTPCFTTSCSRATPPFFIDKSGHILKKRVGFVSTAIVTQGASMAGASRVELDKGFEKDLQDLLKK